MLHRAGPWLLQRSQERIRIEEWGANNRYAAAVMTPLVSIILPAYNAEETVADAIASILLQTYLNWELLFIDDGSRDGTLKIVRQFKDPRIRIYADGRNMRLSARLNEGIDHAGGKYLARMDADDLCFPDRLARQVEYLESHPEIDLLGTSAILFNPAGDVTGRFPFRQTHDEICRHPWNGFYLPHPTWMGRVEWFRSHHYRIPEIERAEDQDLLLRSYPGSRFACLQEILFAYRVRDKPLLRVSRVARRNFLRAQMQEFYFRSEWQYLLLAVSMFVVKSAADIWRVLWDGNARHATADPEGDAASLETLRLHIASCRDGL